MIAEKIVEIKPREDRVTFSRGFSFWGDQSEAANRLIQVNILNTQPATVADTIKMTYDGFGRRVGITELHGATTITSNSFSFVWCGTKLCQERDSSGVTVMKQYYALGEQWVTGANAGSYYFTKDHLGSIREMVDGNGVVQARYDYDPYGRQIKSPGETLDADFGYTGFYMERAAGLDLTWFRAYDANKARWLNRDKLGELEGFNLYAYVGNNSLGWLDLFGLCGDPISNPNSAPIVTTGNPPTNALSGAAAGGGGGLILGAALRPLNQQSTKLVFTEADAKMLQTGAEFFGRESINEFALLGLETGASGGAIFFLEPDECYWEKPQGIFLANNPEDLIKYPGGPPCGYQGPNYYMLNLNYGYSDPNLIGPACDFP